MFNDAFNKSERIASNDKIFIEQWTKKDTEEAVVSYWKDGPGNFLEGLQEPTIASEFEDETGHLLNTITYFTYRHDISITLRTILRG
jgi:hypothetical protein